MTGTATKAPARVGRLGRWRAWRGRRPFLGGVLVFLAGGEMLLTLQAPFSVLMHVGLQGVAGYLVPAVLMLCGALIIAEPQQRTFHSVLSVLLSLSSWLTSNLGGFVLGMALGLTGACLAFGWLPEQPPRRRLLRFRRRPGEGSNLPE